MSYFVAIPRKVAIELATIERDALMQRAQGRCAPAWRAAGALAGEVVQALKSGRDDAALKLLYAVAHAWRAAAECDGLRVTPGRLAVRRPPAGRLRGTVRIRRTRR